MPTLPVTDLRNRQAEIVQQLDATPFRLTRGGYGADVLVQPAQRDQVILIEANNRSRHQ